MTTAPSLVLRDADEDRVLVIEEEEPRYTVDPVEVARLVRQRLDQVVGRQVAEEVRRQTRGLLGVAPTAPILRIEDEDGTTHEVTGEELRAAIDVALQRTATQSVRTAINAATGRLD